MSTFGTRVVAACVVVAAVGLMAGCLASRQDYYAGLHRSRVDAYTRWQTAREDDEELPRLEGELGIPDAVRVALAYNKELWRVVQERAKARGQLWEAYGEALPDVELSAGYTRLDQVMVVDLGVDRFQVGNKNNWSYQLSVTQPLFKGGTIPAAIRGAQIFRYASDESIRQAIQDVVQQVVSAYYDHRLAERLYEVQEEALRFAEANLKDVKAKLEQGLAIRYDVLRAELEVATVRADLIQARNRLSRAETDLLRAMGASQRSEVEMTDSLTYVPMEPSSEDAVRTAFLNRPALYRGELDVRLQREVLRGLYAGYWPNIEAWGWFRWAKPDPHESSNYEWDRQWQTGVRLVWTLFDGLAREGRIKQQKATLRQSAIALSDTEQAVLKEVKDALLALGDAEELVESQRLNLQQANEALRLVTIGRREGVNTPLEVLDARATLTQVRGLYYEALHNHAQARLAYQRAVGLLGPKPGEREVPAEVPLTDLGEESAGPAGSSPSPEEPVN
ncbi:MAG: TolC family protein [Candidatus Brocadiia bacterium]